MSTRRWLILIALLALVGVTLGVLAGRDSAQPTERLQPTPDVSATEAGASPFDGAVALPTLEPTAVARGRAVYERACASCHGVQGEGEPDWQTPREDGSLPAPPHDPSGHTWHHPDGELRRIIAEGGVVYDPDSGMPGFGDQLSDAEIDAVLAYIKSLWTPRERGYQADQTLQWQLMQAQATPEAP